MKFITDRYFKSHSNLNFNDYIITNLYNNKGVLLSDDIKWDINKSPFCEDILEGIDIPSDKEGKFFELNLNSMEITSHNAPVFKGLNKKNNDKNEYRKHIRNVSEVNVNYILDNICDNKYGIIYNMYKDIHSSDYCLSGAEISPIPEKRLLETGYGRAKNFEDAKKEAVLEALERICLFKDIKGCKNVELQDLVEKLGFNEFENMENKPVICAPATDVRTGETVYVPRDFFSYVSQAKDRIVKETSNGTALGGTEKEALIYSLLELIERDAFLTFWLKKVKLNQISQENLPSDIKKTITNFINDDIKLYLFDMTFDVEIPVVLCLIISKKIKPCTYLSSAAHINMDVAIRGAIKEAIVAHNIYRNNKSVGKKYNSPKEVVDLSDHYNYYARREKIKTYDFLLKNNEAIKYDLDSFRKNEKKWYDKMINDDAALEYLLEKLKNVKRIYAHHYNDEYLTKCGFECVKAVSPDFQPMYFGYGNERINKNRIELALKDSKYKDKALLKEGEFNNDPHPFP